MHDSDTMHVLCFYDVVVMQLSTAFASIFLPSIQCTVIEYAAACAIVSRLGSRVLRNSNIKLLMSMQNLQSSSAFRQYAG